MPEMEDKEPFLVTAAERQLIEILREWSELPENLCVTIEYNERVWDVTLTGSIYGRQRTTRGTGATFATAWFSDDRIVTSTADSEPSLTTRHLLRHRP